MSAARSEDVSLPAAGGAAESVVLGDLSSQNKAAGVVVFAHGSGSSRHSERNRWVAEQLQAAGFDTLLTDLLTAEEEQRDIRTAEHRFDIPLLTQRVLGVLDWLVEQSTARGLPVGVFGASTGAAAALGAAARRPELVRSVVSRGGRPDLASEPLEQVSSPTLLIVGGRDLEVLELNRSAAERLEARHEVRVVDGATHLFEEPGALDEVATAAADWFGATFTAQRPSQ
ncbi:dienelactone hydrolase family protein [Parasphingorhabdus pacifica]